MPLALPGAAQMPISIALWAALTLVCACRTDSGAHASSPASHDPAASLPGGATSTSLRPFPSSDRPASNLPQAARPDFYAGRALAAQPWVKAPTLTDARDGLGPLYNARTCLACHTRGGKGHAPVEGQALGVGSLVRISIPGKPTKHGAVPEPTYGLQFQNQSTALSHQLQRFGASTNPRNGPPVEVEPRVHWEEQAFIYPDGQQIMLRRPRLEVTNLGYGPLHPQTLFSLRVAPPLHGLGLIELIDQSAISALADPEDQDGDGISGRFNSVWDFRANTPALGRFGYKANRSNLDNAVAAAFAGDLGITNSLFPQQPCTQGQPRCLAEPSGAGPDGFELSDRLLSLAVDYNRNLGVPQGRSQALQRTDTGRTLFHRLGCAACHHPQFVTGASQSHPHLAAQRIWPYSDFLLHDMGPDLADGRPDYDATGSEWRTSPLWSIGLSERIAGTASYLHDGRARTLEEAVLWHGGEALAVKERFVALSTVQRGQLLSFLASL